jgi:hypothetical protein
MVIAVVMDGAVVELKLVRKLRGDGRCVRQDFGVTCQPLVSLVWCVPGMSAMTAEVDVG